MGGEFASSWATHTSYTGATLIEIPSAAPEAVTALERAAELYAAGPGPGDVHSAHCETLARADLAAARLRAGASMPQSTPCNRCCPCLPASAPVAWRRRRTIWRIFRPDSALRGN